MSSIKKIVLGDTVTVHVNEEHGTGKFTSKKKLEAARPHPDFKKALQLLSGHVKRKCGFAKKVMDNIVVTGVTIGSETVNEEVVDTIQITAKILDKDGEDVAKVTVMACETEFPKELEAVKLEARRYRFEGKRLSETFEFPKDNAPGEAQVGAQAAA